MNLCVLLSFVTVIWNVEAFSLQSSKRMTEPWQGCFAHIGEGVFRHYAKDEGGEWFAGYIGEILKECLAKEGEEKDCLIGKKDEVHAIVKDENDFKAVEQLVGALYQIGEAIHGACHDKPQDKILECAGNVIPVDEVCKTPNGDVDKECVMFFDLLEMLTKQCFEKGEEEEEEKRVLTKPKPLDRLRSLLASNENFLKRK